MYKVLKMELGGKEPKIEETKKKKGGLMPSMKLRTTHTVSLLAVADIVVNFIERSDDCKSSRSTTCESLAGYCVEPVQKFNCSFWIIGGCFLHG